VLLGHDERDKQHSGERELGDRAGLPPADMRSGHKRVDKEQQASRAEHGTTQVEIAARRPLAVVLEQPQRADDHNRSDRHVDEEHRAPAGSP
jgi:hypothetical protein